MSRASTITRDTRNRSSGICQLDDEPGWLVQPAGGLAQQGNRVKQARSGLRPWLGSKGRGSKGRSPIGANLSGLGYKAASTPVPLPLLSPLPPRIKASGQPHKRYGINHNRANAAAPEAVGGRLIIRRGSGGRRGRGDDRHAVPIGQRLERPNREARLPAWLVSNRCQARLGKLARMRQSPWVGF